MAAAAATVERLDAFAREFAWARGASPDAAALERFRERMDDDLDTPNAVAGAFDLRKDARAATDERARASGRGSVRHLRGRPRPPALGDVEALPPRPSPRPRRRDEARAVKDWARADALRAELQAEGWIVEDGPDGTTIRLSGRR